MVVPLQIPLPLHRSFFVPLLPSLHPVPAEAWVGVHSLVPTAVQDVVHCVAAGQLIGVPLQLPSPLHVSLYVLGDPSLQAVPGPVNFGMQVDPFGV